MDHQRKSVEFDVIEEDDFRTRIPGQVFAVVSITRPFDIHGQTKVGFKIKGVFPSRHQAEEKAKELSASDQRYDIFVSEMYKWLLLPPDISNIEDQRHSDNNMLTQLLQSHDNQAEIDKLNFEERKSNMQNQSGGSQETTTPTKLMSGVMDNDVPTHSMLNEKES